MNDSPAKPISFALRGISIYRINAESRTDSRDSRRSGFFLPLQSAEAYAFRYKIYLLRCKLSVAEFNKNTNIIS